MSPQRVLFNETPTMCNRFQLNDWPMQALSADGKWWSGWLQSHNSDGTFDFLVSDCQSTVWSRLSSCHLRPRDSTSYQSCPCECKTCMEASLTTARSYTRSGTTYGVTC